MFSTVSFKNIKSFLKSLEILKNLRKDLRIIIYINIRQKQATENTAYGNRTVASITEMYRRVAATLQLTDAPGNGIDPLIP